MSVEKSLDTFREVREVMPGFVHVNVCWKCCCKFMHRDLEMCMFICIMFKKSGFCRKPRFFFASLSFFLYFVFNFWISVTMFPPSLTIFCSLLLCSFSCAKLSVCLILFFIPFINEWSFGHEKQTFTMTTSILDMSRPLLCLCLSLCVRVAQLLSRWNAHYAADDNSVESEVCAPLYPPFPQHFFLSFLLYLISTPLSPYLPFLPADGLLLLFVPPD